MKIHLVTFATKDYLTSAFLLRKTALNNGFDYVHLYTEDNITDFIKDNPDLFKHKRGFGLWCWKPYVILETLKKVPDGDLVFYLDSAIKVLKNMSPLFKSIKENNNCFYLVGTNGNKDTHYYVKDYTKEEVLKELNVLNNEHILNSGQISAGLHGHINNSKTFNIISEWLNLCTQEKLMTDEGCKINNRHDQSILTILVYKYNLYITHDISQYGKGDIKDHIQYIDHHRQRLSTPSIGIITSSIGNAHFKETLESVQNLNYFNYKHYVVVSGKKYSHNVRKQVDLFKNKNEIILIDLPDNKEANDFMRYRIYSALPYLIDTDYVVYLDDGNTLEPNFLDVMLNNIITKKTDFVYCMRNIIDKDGNFVCKDKCESLGDKENIEKTNLIDTNCYLMTRKLALKISYQWYNLNYSRNPYYQDKVVSKYLLSNHSYSFIPNCLINYRVKNIANFSRNNKKFMLQNIKKRGLYLFHFNKKATNDFFENVSNLSNLAYKDWQLTMPSLLNEKINLVNGYTNKIETGSTILVNIGLPQDLPKELQRDDIYKIGYTVEGPNIRHQQQWNEDFLFKAFDKVMTYWTYLLNKFPEKTIYCPFIHRLTFTNKVDDKYLSDKNDISKKNIIMILQKRNFGHEYKINNQLLHSLDYLREEYVDALDNIKAHGESWKDYHNQDKVVVLPSRFVDKPMIDYIKNFTFNLIIENTDAEGYVSEKIYDAWVAGAIPIYINKGNITKRLNLPTDCYIDGGRMTPVELNDYINNLSLDDIKTLKENILSKRKEILKRDGPNAYLDAVIKTLSSF